MDTSSSEGQLSELSTSEGLGADAFLPGPTGEEAAGADVAAALRGRIGGVQVGEERRWFVRLPWLRLVPIWVAEEGGSGRRTRKLDVLIHDVSAGGFGFISGEYLNPGTTVRAQFDCLPNRPVVTSIIRHCVHLGGTHHRIGVQFTK